jgi:hypothetical protein
VVGDGGTLSLGVNVPGGQQVYIASDGEMSYTSAHSANIPGDAVRDGWSKTGCDNSGKLSFKGGLYACPGDNGYQVYGQTSTVPFNDQCLGFEALASMFGGV